jgi:hypothetical protein
VHHDWLLRNGLFSEMMSMPLLDHSCYGVVLCPFGLPAGMHAEAACNTLGVADLSVGGLVPCPQHTWPGNIHAEACLTRGLCHSYQIRGSISLPISVDKNILVVVANIIRVGTPLLRRTHHLVTPHTSLYGSPQTLYIPVMHLMLQ